MAKKKTAKRKSYGKKLFGKLNLNKLLETIGAGVATGVVQSFIPNDALGGYADTGAPLLVGYFMKNETLMTLGGYQLGLKIASQLGQGKGSVGFVSQG